MSDCKFKKFSERMADSSADELSEKIRQVCQKIDMTADPEISSPHEISTQEGFRCFSHPITSP